MKRSFLAFVFSIVLATSFSAFAQENANTTSESAATETKENSDKWARELSVEITGGIDTPHGLIGGNIGYTPIKHLRLSAGAGYSRDGLVFAFQARGMLSHAESALGFGLGLSGGQLSWESGKQGDQFSQSTYSKRFWDFALGLNADVSYEYRFTDAIYARFYFGVNYYVTNHDRCNSDTGLTTCAQGQNPIRPFVGLSLGYAVDL